MLGALYMEKDRWEALPLGTAHLERQYPKNRNFKKVTGYRKLCRIFLHFKGYCFHKGFCYICRAEPVHHSDDLAVFSIRGRFEKSSCQAFSEDGLFCGSPHSLTIMLL